MRQISQLPIIKEVSTAQPFGAILDETDTQDGTPVVRAIYNDHLVNNYKLLETTGITPTGDEDGEDTQYQVLEALQKLTNVHNDIEQILTLSSGVWSVPFDLSILPNKYVFIARASSDYVSGTFRGVNVSPSYSFTSPGFDNLDELLVVIDQSGVRAYSISKTVTPPPPVVEDLFTVMGNPITYNDSDTFYYQEFGNLITDVPKVDFIQDVIRTDVADNTVLVTEMFVITGYLLCVVFYPIAQTYKFRQLEIVDLSLSTEVAQVGFTIPSGVDNNPYFYSDENSIYITNTNGTTANDNDITIVNYNPVGAVLNIGSFITLDASFIKTSNAGAKAKLLYTMINGALRSFNLLTGSKSELGNFNTNVGTLFNYKGDVYFSAGEVAKKWF